MALPFHLDNPSGIWALLLLLPLIILYLIRPRPKPMAIPSLMFFLKSTGSRKLTSFLKQITHDWLFILQLLLLTALAMTFTHPFTTYEHDITASNTVLVIDVSASSQVEEGPRTRFDNEIAQAKKLLGTKNTVILAKDVPYIALQDATPEETSSFLLSLKPQETTSRIGEAIILAGETLGSEGRAVVLSDFINTAGQDPDIAKAVLQTKGIVVDFINVAGPKRKNVGIIQMDPANDQTTLYVKNYNDNLENVPITVGSTQTTLSIAAHAIETYSFKTPPGVTQIQLNANDDFPVDNVAYLSAPNAGKAKVLLVANNASTYLKNALLASGDTQVTLTEPPVIPKGDFDVIILNNLDPKKLLPGTLEDFKARVDKGSAVIIGIQDISSKIDYKGLLPVTLDGKGDGGPIAIEQLTRFTKNIDFGATNSVTKANPIGDQSIIATVNKIPLITIKHQGLGKLVYFGIPEDSEFKFSPHYPIFWTELMKYVTEQQDVHNLNLKTGETLLLDKEEKIKTPATTIKRAALLLEEQGLYQLEDRVIAANLLSDEESTINAEKPVGTKSTEYQLKPVKEQRKFPLDIVLLALALFLVLFEVFFIKYRGDL